MNNCSADFNQKYAYGSAISNGKIVYSRSNYLYVHNLTTSGTKCPNSNRSALINYRAGSYVGLQFNPSNNTELWTLSWTQSRMQKLSLNANYTAINSTLSFGKRSRNNSDASNTYFYYPWGLGWDQNNSRLIAADLNKGSVQIFNLSLIHI